MKKIIFLLMIFAFTTMNAFSTVLPKELTEYIAKKVPNATIRFDGLIMFQDKTTYMPLIPAIEPHIKTLTPVYSYPAKTDLNKKPEIIVFNNNYVLLKVIKDKNGLTITKDTNYPLIVKAGVLPQDMLVPKGLFIPESLEGILGDLKIPIGKNNNIISKNDQTETHNEINDFLDKTVPVTIPKIAALKNKLFFVSNYDSNYIRVINSDNTQPVYSLKLDSIPKSIIPVKDKYLLITTGAKTHLDIIDIHREEIAKQLDLLVEPYEIVVDENKNIAYVSAKDENALFVINLNTMELKQKVLVTGYPTNLTLSPNGEKIVYQDRNSAKFYVVSTIDEFKIKYLNTATNISKVIATDNAIFILCRTKNQLIVSEYPSEDDYEDEELGSPVRFSKFWEVNETLPSPIKNLTLAKKDVSQKPVDMVLYQDKLYILSAKYNKIDVYNTKTNEIIQTIDLPITGFSKKLTRVDKTNYIIISNAVAEKYLIFDMNTNSTVQQVPINTKINNLVIISKTQQNKKNTSL